MSRATQVAAVLALLVTSVTSCVEPTLPVSRTPAAVVVYAVWLEGTTDGNRAELDAFFDCLIEHSTFSRFFGERVTGLRYGGSVAIAPPTTQLVYPDTDTLLRDARLAGTLPRPSGIDERAVYVVFASGTHISLQFNACGRTALQRLDDDTDEIAVAFVRNDPLCWPTGERLRTETQISMHELAEAIELLFGNAPCVGDGACEGRADCGGVEACNEFVGLACAGAPAASYTGCDGQRVEGWVVQTLASTGRDWNQCETCMPCDFTPRACRADEPDCP